MALRSPQASMQVFLQCPKPIFYAYTRSWRVAAIEPVLRDMAQLPNVDGNAESGMARGVLSPCEAE